MLISGKSQSPPVMSVCQSRLRSPRGPWKDLLHWVPVTENRKESDLFGLTHNHFVSLLYLSPHLRFSLFLSLTQSLYLYVVFGLHRSLFRGIRSSCAAQVMLAQMKQNGLFSPFPASLRPLSLNLLFSLPLFNLNLSVQALVILLSLPCLSFYFPLFCMFLLQSHTYLLPLF